MALKDGIYEKVISEGLDKELKEALQKEEIWVGRDDKLDSQDAVAYLASYLRNLISSCLKEIADRNDGDTMEDEIRLTNEVISLLRKKIESLEDDCRVVSHDFLLTSIEHRRNKGERKDWVRPDTSVSHSFLFTNSRNDTSMASELRKEIASSDRIDFLVSFIRFTGLSMILPYLREFTNHGGKLRVITTTYMGATDPKAVEVLASLPNTEIHISYNVKETRLHAKSYMFHRDSGFSTAYVGSSNLSHAAIADGLEWNVKITQQDLPNIIEKMRATFETYWNSADFERFEKNNINKLREAIDRERGRNRGEESGVSYQFDIKPYPYQQVILDALETERKERNHWKNLVVAATGTGKTAISAFDYRNFATRRKGNTKLLFIAHREEILKQSISCFRQVLKDANFGELAVGGRMPQHIEHLFMSVQTFNSRRLWEHVDADYYDMIIVDEFHHAAADSYQKLLSYFKPRILLGLTATPERMDGKDIFRYFDHHIAAEIRLSDAIERRLLCPFHYFGVADPVDLSGVKWVNGQYDGKELDNLFVFKDAPAIKRASAVMEAVDTYSADLRDVKGIGFCVSKNHAHFMADYFKQHGIPSIALDSDSPDNVRKKAKQELESGRITFIFVVDLFNEGVDIPSVNTVLFLRPTNSITIFLQQLGRGLRLYKGKDCLTVLDFVAQANKKYDFASRFQAILGKKSGRIKEEIQAGFPHVPKGCSIQLEKIAEKRVLENIRRQVGQTDYYIGLIRDLYAVSHKVPSLEEFFKAGMVDPKAFYNGKRSYAGLCREAEVIPDFPLSEEEKLMNKAFPRMLSMDSGDWIRFIRNAFETLPSQMTKKEKLYLRMWQYTVWQKDYKKSGMDSPLEAVTRLCLEPAIKREIEELLDYQYNSFTVIPEDPKLPYECPLEVYCNYSRDQLLAALGVSSPRSVMAGVKYLHKGNSDVVTSDTDVFLITLNKSAKEFSDTTLYEDYSISDELFHWQSQSTTSPQSPTGQRYINQRENGDTVLLFVRQAKKDSYGNSMCYTFLGPAHIMSWKGSRPITIIYKLDYKIPAKYLLETDSSGVL